MSSTERRAWLEQLRERGVLRVAASYAVIGWLLLQIADVTFEPLGLPRWSMTALIVAVVLGFPVAILLAWFFELGDAGVARDTAPDAVPRPRVHGLRRHADVAVIGVLLVVVAVLVVRQSDLGKPPLPAKPSLAVLPFANLTADPAQQYFSDGLAEEVLDRLGQVPGLMVVARSSSFVFRERGTDVREVATKLGVNAVLEGAVRRDGKRLRLSAKLVDGKSGYQLWSGSFDREVNDVFAVQAELAQAVIDAIVPVARGDEPVTTALPATPPTLSVGAYDLYLLGRAKANTRWPEDMRQAVDYFEQSLAQDPKFAKAQAALAFTLALLIVFDEDASSTHDERVERAEAAAYRALALDPKLAESQVAYATFLRVTQREGAEAAYKRAIELNPNSAEAWHGYALFLGHDQGQDVASEAATRRAHELDPLAISTWMNYLGQVLRPGAVEFRRELHKAHTAFAGNANAQRRFAIAAGTNGYPLEAWQVVTATRRDPSFNVPRVISNVGPLGIWLYVDPRYTIEHGTPLLDDPEVAPSWAWLVSMLVTAHGELGHEQEVRALLARELQKGPEEARRFHLLGAFWLSVFGRFEEAAQAYAALQPVPENDDESGTLVGVSLDQQALPALLRVYRATGRTAEADALAARTLASYRAAQPRKPQERRYEYWVRDAALAANEGLKAEAIRWLRHAMDWQDVPIGFVPSLPWFRSLEGQPGYDALLEEHATRQARARAGMLALDATLPAPSPAAQSSSDPSRPTDSQPR